MKIIENIKSIRIAKQIKQQVLADVLNVDIASISNLENGKRELKASELEPIATALGVSVVDLITHPVKYAPIANQETQEKEDPIEAILQIKLNKEKKDQVFQLVFGVNCIDIFNR